MTTFGAPNLLALLDDTERASLSALGQRRSYRDQEVIHERGDVGASLSIVIEGRVSLHRILSNGSIIFASSVMAGQNYADAASFSGGARTHRAIAQGATIVDHFDSAAFQEILDHHPSVLKALYLISAYRLNLAIEMLDDTRILPTRVRLAKMILRMAKSSPLKGAVPGRQEDLGQILGLSTVSVIQNLKMLAAEGLIATGYRQIKVPDLDRLELWIKSLDWD
ncbi:MAG: Crp/Fnr family transcriptional regulator [Novosphingobium sp.]